RALVRWRRVSRLPYREPWVMRVAANVAIDMARRRRPLTQTAEVVDDATDAVALRAALSAALAALSRRQREVVSLRYVAGLSERPVPPAGPPPRPPRKRRRRSSPRQQARQRCRPRQLSPAARPPRQRPRLLGPGYESKSRPRRSPPRRRRSFTLWSMSETTAGRSPVLASTTATECQRRRWVSPSTALRR